MKVTFMRKMGKNAPERIHTEEFSRFLDHIKADTKAGYIHSFRNVTLPVDQYDHWMHYYKIPQVCPACVCKKDAKGGHRFVEYTGITMLTVNDLHNELAINQVKRTAALYPQTLCAFKGADGRSVVIWTVATLPGGDLPQTEELADLFCQQAYVTSVAALAPSMEFPFSLCEPRLYNTCMLTVDEQPYVNPHPAPFIIEQPSLASLSVLKADPEMASSLERMRPGKDSILTFHRIFDAAYEQASDDMPEWRMSEHGPWPKVVRVAERCAVYGLPEEECVMQLRSYFYNQSIDEIRATVRNVYNDCKHPASRRALRKHQTIAYRLREFLNRRYEIRYNTVLRQSEYRERYSVQFLFRPLGKRELNNIYHEACVEGVEPTFGEVERLVGSNFIPQYNPIDDYLSHLPEWDGRDRISEVASLVPNDNPSWPRLFRQWFLSMVAHWMIDDATHANQSAPILVGAQGYRKSTFCRMLLPPELQQFFTDSLDFRTKIESERYLSRFLLVNIDEFDQLNEKQVAYVKHLFQKPVTNLRGMWSETIGTQRRYASFIGTSNCSELLTDPTGSRRYICIKVTSPIRIDEGIDYKQLYAQARHAVESGERYWLNDEDEKLITTANKDFEVESPLEAIFLATFEIPSKDEVGEWLTPAEILLAMSSHKLFNKKRHADTRQLGQVLNKLNVERSRSKSGTTRFVRLRK